MTKPIVIIESLSHDIHATAVAWCLREQGVKYAFLFSANIPTHASVGIDLVRPAEPELFYNGPEVNIRVTRDSHLVYWARRLDSMVAPIQLAQEDRAFARRENKASLDAWRGLVESLPGAVFVNSLGSKLRANHKPRQLVCASTCGLNVPKTLFTSNRDEILTFIDSLGGKVIYKTATPAVWRQVVPNGARNFMVYSSFVDREMIASSNSVSLAAGIYQQPIDKDYEVRITMMGSSCFGSKILSQESESTSVDWRANQREVRNEPLEIPLAIQQRCKKFLSEMGLLFGCFDFIVTPDGEWVFLECNEQGQWLWQEAKCESISLLDAFSQFIQQPSIDFSYQPRQDTFRFRDYRDKHWIADEEASKAINYSVESSHVSYESRGPSV